MSRLAALFLLLATLLAHGLGLRNGFVYDDHRFVDENPALQTATPLDFLLDPATQTRDSDRDIYRPLRALGHAWDWRLWHGEPFGFHLHSLLVHLMAVLLGYLVLRQHLRQGADGAALLGATLLAVHPLGVEAVGWITSRGDLYALAFGLAALLAALAADREVPAASPRWARAVWLLAAAVLACLALLGKESALWIAGAAWLHRRSLRPSDSSAGAWSAGVIALCLGLACGVGLRLWALGAHSPMQTALHGGSWLAQTGWALFGTGQSLLHLLWPSALSVEYPQQVWAGVGSGWRQPQAWLALGVVLLPFWLRRRPAGMVWAWLLGWVLLAYLPSSSLLVTLRGLVNDRALYPCLLPLGALLGLSLAKWPAAARSAALLVAVACIPLAAERQAVFRDDRSLWLDALSKDPRCVAAHVGLAALATDRDEEHGHLLAAVQAAPAETLLQGLSLARLGDFELRQRHAPETALPMLTRALELLRRERERISPGPHEATTAASLAETLALLGRYDEAESVLQMALLEQPAQLMLHIKRGTLGILQAQREAAETGWLRAAQALAAAQRLQPEAPEVKALAQVLDQRRRAAGLAPLSSP
ncbi:MAG: hypothetical protein ACT4PU_02285 [Planctomycetota bacterium]